MFLLVLVSRLIFSTRTPLNVDADWSWKIGVFEMKAFVFAAALLVLAPAATVAFANDVTPSYDSCHNASVHGVWDCR